jgi:hypothetical protein
MESGLKYEDRRWPWTIHEVSGGFNGRRDSEMAISRRYLEIKETDSDDLIAKKRAMHALLLKYGYPY